jgi:hypothetical protein
LRSPPRVANVEPPADDGAGRDDRERGEGSFLPLKRKNPAMKNSTVWFSNNLVLLIIEPVCMILQIISWI